MFCIFLRHWKQNYFFFYNAIRGYTVCTKFHFDLDKYGKCNLWPKSYQHLLKKLYIGISRVLLRLNRGICVTNVWKLFIFSVHLYLSRELWSSITFCSIYDIINNFGNFRTTSIRHLILVGRPSSWFYKPFCKISIKILNKHLYIKFFSGLQA